MVKKQQHELKDLMPSGEQLEFTFDFEEGERLAPVSAMYKSFINTMMNQAMEFAEVIDKRVHFVAVMNLKEVIKTDELFLKTSKKFQSEVHGLLDMPFEDLYFAMRGREYVPNEEASSGAEAIQNFKKKHNIAVNNNVNVSTNTGIKNKVNLRLVK